MPKIQELTPNPSFSSQLGGALGQGVAEGLQQNLARFHEQKKRTSEGMAFAQAIGKPELGEIFAKVGPDNSKILLEQFGAENLANNIARIQGIQLGRESPSQRQAPPQQAPPQQAIQPQGAQGEPTPLETDAPPPPQQDRQKEFQEMFNQASPKDKEKLLRAYNEERKVQTGEKKLDQQKELQYIKMNEPKITELQDRVDALENTGTELERLETIFNEGKLPSAFTTAMFDLEGEGGLSDFGRSQLHEDAQEAVKIVANQIRGISKIFPGRILQSEITNFMKTLPGLMNTPEGRKRIVRGMRIFNDMAQIQGNSILDEMSQAGGPGKILFSEAKNRAHIATKESINQLRDIYLHPEKRDFEALPPANLFKGKEFEDETTGEIVYSNGNEWVPKRNK